MTQMFWAYCILASQAASFYSFPLFESFEEQFGTEKNNTLLEENL